MATTLFLLNVFCYQPGVQPLPVGGGGGGVRGGKGGSNRSLQHGSQEEFPALPSKDNSSEGREKENGAETAADKPRPERAAQPRKSSEREIERVPYRNL